MKKLTSDYLIKLRYKSEYTQNELAVVSGVNRASISNYEMGIALPKIDVFIHLIEAMNGSLTDFDKWMNTKPAGANGLLPAAFKGGLMMNDEIKDMINERLMAVYNVTTEANIHPAQIEDMVLSIKEVEALLILLKGRLK